MKNKQKLLDRIIDFYLTGHNLKEDEAKAVISLKDEYKAINYSRCCTELNHDFKKGDDVWITSKTLVTIADFTECGKRVQVEDGCNYYLVDIDEITKVV